MPRYFFHVIDGQDVRDEDGAELTDIFVAQSEAIRLTGEILRDTGGRFWDGTEWRLQVEDARGRGLFALRFVAEEWLTQPGSETNPEAGSEPGPPRH